MSTRSCKILLSTIIDSAFCISKMKRIQMCKKVNRNNNTIFNHLARKPPRINTITPEMLVGQIWLEEEEPTKSVEIIELNSSGEPEMSPQHIHQDDDAREESDNAFCVSQDENMSHAWCYANKDCAQRQGDKHKINKKARERRRAVENHRVPTNSLSNIDEYDSDIFSNIYDNISSNHLEEKINLNHQMNYFTILNKHFINSDTSSDSDDGDVEMMAPRDIVLETTDDWDPNGSYEEEIITYDPTLDKETRTIWIYSFKNKHLLTEDEMEMLNTSDKETSSGSTTYSFENDDYRTKNKYTSVTRLSSPIPAIPRLNLSLDPVLSTVTEVTESNKQISSNETKGSGRDKIQKPKNSWIDKDNNVATERIDYKGSRKHEKSTNIVNWMALSPREKRRRFNDSGDKWKGTILHLGESCHSEKTVKRNTSQNESGIVETVEVQADVHVSEQAPKKRSVRTPKSADAIIKGINNDTTQIIKESDLNTQHCDKDRGDHEMKCGRKPQINVSNKLTINAANITDPIEKLDSCNWIYEERVEKQTGTYDYISDGVECEVYSKMDENNELNVTWIKNTMGLMKPALWTEYLPITNTPLSLHLSLSSVVENKRQSWFKRFAKCIICCK